MEIQKKDYDHSEFSKIMIRVISEDVANKIIPINRVLEEYKCSLIENNPESLWKITLIIITHYRQQLKLHLDKSQVDSIESSFDLFISNFFDKNFPGRLSFGMPKYFNNSWEEIEEESFSEIATPILIINALEDLNLVSDEVNEQDNNLVLGSRICDLFPNDYILKLLKQYPLKREISDIEQCNEVEYKTFYVDGSGRDISDDRLQHKIYSESKLINEINNSFESDTDDNYCGACMESPCMCSDREKTSLTLDF